MQFFYSSVLVFALKYSIWVPTKQRFVHVNIYRESVRCLCTESTNVHRISKLILILYFLLSKSVWGFSVLLNYSASLYFWVWNCTHIELGCFFLLRRSLGVSSPLLCCQGLLSHLAVHFLRNPDHQWNYPEGRGLIKSPSEQLRLRSHGTERNRQRV